MNEAGTVGYRRHQYKQATTTQEEMKMAKPDVVIETVTMQDGRVVDFAGKRRLIKTSVIADGKVQVQLDFRNGESRTFTVPDALMLRFAAHGAEQKLGDELAGLTDTDDCVIAIDELIDRLYNGEWGVKREGNGLAGTSILLRALVEHTGKTPEQIKAYLADKDHAQKTALRNNPKIKAIADRLEAEKLAKKGVSVDTDAMLDELSAG